METASSSSSKGIITSTGPKILDVDEWVSVFSLSYYDPGQREMKTSRPVVRAVVGGTGDYIGARGEVRTEHLPDGTYEHVFTLLD